MPQQATSTQGLKHSGYLAWTQSAGTTSAWMLCGGLICIAVILSLRFSLGFNSPYVDESDYMFAGRMLLDGQQWPTKSYIFSSNLPLFLIGFGTELHPQWGARALALLPGLLSLAILMRLYHRLLSDRTLAIISTALITVQATHIFQSKFATYDIWCLFFFVAACWQLVEHKITKRAVSVHLLVGAITFSVAVLCKYVVVAYLPFVFVFLYLACNRGTALVFATVQMIVLGIYGMQNLADLNTLLNTQLGGQHLNNSSALQVFNVMIYVAWPVFLLALPGAVSTLRFRLTFVDRPIIGRKLIYTLLVLSAVLPAYHLLSGNRIAVYKHMIYTLIFVAPITATGLTAISKYAPQQIRAAIFPLIAVGLVGFAWQQTKTMEQAFPNTTQATRVFESLATHTTTVLSENPYLHRNLMYKKIALQKLFDMDSLPSIGQPLLDFIDKNKFQLLILDERFHPEKTRFIRDNLSTRYRLAYEASYVTSDITSSNTNGKITIHQLME